MTSTTIRPELGTVSSGTMLPSDLIPAFMGTLETYAPELAAELVAGYPELDGMDADELDASEEANWIIEALYQALDSIAPDGAYFGSHPGDGSDYGFWTVEGDEIEECECDAQTVHECDCTPALT